MSFPAKNKKNVKKSHVKMKWANHQVVDTLLEVFSEQHHSTIPVKETSV